MALVVPAGMLTNSTTKFVVVSAIANIAAPKLTEINAVSSVDISCYITGDGFSQETSENTITDERLCSRQIFEEPGDFQESLEISFIYNNLDEDGDAARLALPPYASKFAVVRVGKEAEDPFILGDLVDVFSFKAGRQRKNAGGRNSKHTMTQKLFLNNIVQRDVAVVAGP